MSTALAVAEANAALAIGSKYTEEALADATPAVGGIVPVPAYLGYAWKKTTNADVKAALRAAGANPDDGVVLFITRAGVVSPVKPLRFHVFDSRIIATHADEDGKPDKAQLQLPVDTSGKPLDKWDRHAFVVMGVYLGGILVPALGEFRGQRMKAINHALTNRRDCLTPAWKSRFTVGGSCPYPPGRFVATGSLRSEKSGTTGRDFITGACSVAQSSAEEVKNFVALMADPQFNADLGAAEAGMNRKLVALLEGSVEDAEVVG